MGLVSHLMTACNKIVSIQVSELVTTWWPGEQDCIIISDLSVSLDCVCMGIFLDKGEQRTPAVANFTGYYCIGLSLSVTLMFAAKLRVTE